VKSRASGSHEQLRAITPSAFKAYDTLKRYLPPPLLPIALQVADTFSTAAARRVEKVDRTSGSCRRGFSGCSGIVAPQNQNFFSTNLGG
jgi:hypothetical protein